MKKVTNDELSESDEVKPSKKKGTNAMLQQFYLLYFPKKNTCKIFEKKVKCVNKNGIKSVTWVF